MRVASHSLYVLTILLICLLLCSVVIGLATSSFYYRHSSSFWDVVEEHQFSVRGQDADILFVGDSSLLFGVSSDLIQRETGSSVYNIGVPMPALAVDLDSLLSQYLAHNKAPRVMILYLSAATRTKPPYAFPPTWYEGETMLLRYGGLRRTVDFFSNNTVEISRFMALAGRRVLAFDWRGQLYRTLATKLDAGRGYIAAPLQAAIDTDNCPLSASPLVPDEEFIRGFRQISADRGISAAVYLAPVPDCDPTFAQTSSNYSRVVDNEPYTLSHTMFLDDPQRAHLVVAGAQENAHRVAAFLNRFMVASNSAAHAP